MRIAIPNVIQQMEIADRIKETDHWLANCELKRARCIMPPIAKAVEMGMVIVNKQGFPLSRKRLRKRVRQFEKTWDPYPRDDQ